MCPPHSYVADDCDTDKQIDECEEDIFPPKINDKIYADEVDAVDCFSTTGLVSAMDDCKDVKLTFLNEEAPVCFAAVLIKAVAQGCGERNPEDITKLKVQVALDADAPVVSCKLDTQRLKGNGVGVFTDLQVSYTAVDGGTKCTATDDLKVSIEVFSTEVVTTGEEVSHCLLTDIYCVSPTILYSGSLHAVHTYLMLQMQIVSISTPAKGTAPSIWAENSVCQTNQNGKCKISSPFKSRKYFVLVTATDKAGNVGMAECETTVGNADVEQEDPRFLIGKLEVVGGVEYSEKQREKQVSKCHRSISRYESEMKHVQATIKTNPNKQQNT